MKRTFLLAAVAGTMSAGAFAQNSVELYGRLNTSIERIKIGDGDADWQQVSNASRIGFRGTEDLGSGLKAGFIIENRFGSNDGTSSTPFWAGQSEVNLSSDKFGMVRLGRFTAESYYASADWIGMHNHDTGTSADMLFAYIPTDDNKIGYRTPTIGGAWAEGEVSLNQAGQKRSYDGALNWAGGALSLGAGLARKAEAKMATVRAVYDMSPFVIGGYYQYDDNGIVAGGGKRNTFRIAGMYTLGASEFHLNYGRSGDYDNIDDSSAKQWTVAYNYNLSKRTKIYAFYTKMDDKAGVTYLPIFYGAGADKLSSFALGLRHNF